eukprot:c4740_g1_i4.p1 GENE.c4740_g1_i4~~c4740_g1_i4.p1  ORF type:complete len:160 (+),score=11.55 c4740_g1_i4:1-480(+)
MGTFSLIDCMVALLPNNNMMVVLSHPLQHRLSDSRRNNEGRRFVKILTNLRRSKGKARNPSAQLCYFSRQTSRNQLARTTKKKFNLKSVSSRFHDESQQCTAHPSREIHECDVSCVCGQNEQEDEPMYPIVTCFDQYGTMKPWISSRQLTRLRSEAIPL